MFNLWLEHLKQAKLFLKLNGIAILRYFSGFRRVLKLT